MTKAKIGFIGASAASSPHHDSFKALILSDIDFNFVQEAGAGRILSKLGLRYKIPRYGKLLATWPALARRRVVSFGFRPAR